MTDEEQTIMFQHVVYWKQYMNNGVAIVFRPVFDPKDTYGLGIVAVDNEGQLASIIGNDHAAKINKYEYYSMRAVMPGSKMN